jgi:hypothetical protein
MDRDCANAALQGARSGTALISPEGRLSRAVRCLAWALFGLGAFGLGAVGVPLLALALIGGEPTGEITLRLTNEAAYPLADIEIIWERDHLRSGALAPGERRVFSLLPSHERGI